MFWNRKGWSKAKSQLKDELIQSHLQTICTDKAAFKESIDAYQKVIKTEPKVEILLIRWRKLNFHHEQHTSICWEFTLREEDTRIFYCTYQAEGSPITAINLDGTSPKMHAMNAKLGGIRFEHGDEYLDFFTSFLHSKGRPFPIVYGTRDVIFPRKELWSTSYFPYHKSSAINNIFRNQSNILPRLAGGTYANEGSIGAIVERIKKELSSAFRYCKSDEVTTRNLRWFERKMKGNASYDRRDISLVESALNAKIPADYFSDIENRTESKAKQDFQCYFRVVVHGQGLFFALFQVQSSGMVTMLDDTKIDVGYTVEDNEDPLPIGHHFYESSLGEKSLEGIDQEVILTIKDFDIINIEEEMLLRAVPVPSIDIEEFLSPEKNLRWLKEVHRGVIFNGYQENHVNLSAMKLFGSLTIQGVSFFTDFDLSEVQVENSVNFIDCEFLGPMKMRNARIGGNLTFDNCKFYGLDFREEEVKKEDDRPIITALDLDNIEVAGHLKVERSISYGVVSMTYGKVGASVQFRGLKAVPLYHLYASSKSSVLIDPRFKGKDGNYGVGLDIRHTDIQGELDLSAYFPKEKEILRSRSVKETAMSTRLAGYISAESCQIGGSVYLSGLVLAPLNGDVFGNLSSYCWNSLRLNDSVIEGNILGWRPAEKINDSFHHQRTYITQSLEFGKARIRGYLDLRGIWVGRGLNFNDMTCNSSIYMSMIDQFDVDFDQSESSNSRFISYEIETWRKTNKPIFQFEEGVTVNRDKLILAPFVRTHILGDVEFRRSIVHGQIKFNGVHIGGSVYINSARLGTIDFGLNINTTSRFKTEEIYGKKNCKFKEYIESQKGIINVVIPNKDAESGLMLVRTEVSRIDIHNSDIQGEIRLDGLWVTSRRSWKDSMALKPEESNYELFQKLQNAKDNEVIYIDENDKEKKDLETLFSDRNAIEIRDSTIKGALQFFEPKPKYLASLLELINAESYQKVRYTQVFYQKDQVSKHYQDVDWLKDKLATLIYDDSNCMKSAYTQGDVVIANSSIGGQIDFSNLLIHGKLTIEDVDADSSITSDTGVSDAKKSLTAFHIDIDILRSEGNLDLSDVVVFDSFRAINTVIAGRTRFLNANIRKRMELSNSMIKGQLDFDGSNSIGSLWFLDLDVLGNVTNKDKLTIKEFAHLELVRCQGRLNFKDLEVRSETDTIPKNQHPLNIDNCTVLGSLILSDATLRSQFQIINSKVSGSIVMTNAVIKDQLQIRDSEVSGSLDMSGATVNSEFQITNGKILGSLILSKAVIDYQVLITESEVSSSLTLSDAELKNQLRIIDSKVSGPLNMSDATIKDQFRITNSKVSGSLVMSDATVQKQFRITNSEVSGSLNMYSATVENKFQITDSEVLGPLILSDAKIEDQFQITNSKVLGTLTMSDARVKYEFQILNSRVLGSLTMSDAKIEDQFRVTNSKVSGELNMPETEVQNRFLITNSEVSGELNMIGASINNEFSVSDSEVLGPLIMSDAKIKGQLQIVNSEVSGSLAMSDAKVEKQFLITDSEVSGSLSISNAELKNCFQITNSKVFGSLILSDTTIDHQFQITNSHVFDRLDLTGLTLGDNIIFRDVQAESTISADLVKGKTFSCLGLRLNRLTCKGNLELSQMKVHGNETFEVTNSKILGHAKFAESDVLAADIKPKLINMSASETSKLSLKVRPTNGAWSLERHKVSHLSVFWDKQTVGALTGSADFRGIHFDRLSINEQDADHSKEVLKFLGLALNDEKKFTLEAHAKVEKNLRNQGRKQDADEIYTDMQKAWRNTVLINERGSFKGIKKGNLRKVSDWWIWRFVPWAIHMLIHLVFFQWYTKFGTKWERPLIIGMIQLLISFSLCTEANNWEIKTDRQSYDTEQFEGDIGYVGAIKAINISLPIITIPLNQEPDESQFQLKTLGPTRVFFVGIELTWISPDSFSSILSFLGWVIWPVFILTLTGVLRRESFAHGF